MPPGPRKLALTAHVVASVGWLGAVVVFLALALVGLNGDDGETVRAVYLATEVVTWAVIVPLCAASLLTGLLQALGTSWGLFRHYWVLFKLLMTLAATLLLLLHTHPIGLVAGAARGGALSGQHLDGLRVQLVADAGAAVLVLLVATVLSVYKPRGLTPYGRRVVPSRARAPS